MTDDIALAIAAQACLIVVNTDQWYDNLTTVLVYPPAFRSVRKSRDGVVAHEEMQGRLGESWSRGPVILSCADSHQGAQNGQDGLNVVLHEFAHHVDGLDGEMDGRPALDRDDSQRWATVSNWEYDRLVARANRREVTLLDQYGASNHAEFFAVSTECFFERPHELRHEHPELYAALTRYYRQSPAQWLPS